MSGTERLVNFPAKTNPSSTDIVYVGDQSNGGNEVQVTIAQLISSGGAGIALLVANNLSDLASAPTARTNLGLGTAAVQNVSFFLQTANNLSDLPSASTARTNLGLGTAAVQNVAFFLQTANNLSDLASASTARTNLGLGSAATKTASGSGSVVASVTGTFTVGHVATFADTNGTIQDGGATSQFLLAANNLSDVSNVATSRTNLGLGTAATKASSSSGATVLAAISGAITSGHYAQFSDTFGTIQDGGAAPAGVLLSANNLSDVNSASTSRTNLGLGTAATENIAFFLQSANNLSDVASASSARTNLGLGTAATKTASDNTKTVVAMISGAITSGHYAQFADTSGTIQDGGSAPAGVLLAANNLSDVNSASTSRTNLGLGSAATANASSASGTVAAVTGAITINHIPIFSDTSGTVKDGGATSQFLLAANNLSDLGSTSTAITNLFGGSTGSGNVVRATSPTLVTPALGTPASGVLTNMTGTQLGTTAGGNAAAGQVGEVISSAVLAGSAVSLTSGTPANVTSISLTAGDWDVYGNVCFIGAGGTVFTYGIASTNTTSATLPDQSQWAISSPSTGTTDLGVVVPSNRINVTTTTTYYLIAQSVFTSTCGAAGAIWARRAR